MVAPFLATKPNEVLSFYADFATAPIHVVDYDIADATRPATMSRLSVADTEELTAELDGATEWLGVASDEILLAALARTIARTLGDGVVPVDVASEGRCLLDAIPLPCAAQAQASATELLGAVHRTVAAATEGAAHNLSEVYFNYLGEVPDEVLCPYRFRTRRPDWAMPSRCACTGRVPACTSTGGTTQAASTPTRSRSSPNSSRWRSSR